MEAIDTVKCQIIDIHGFDSYNNNYEIFVSSRDIDGNNVDFKINDYKPYFTILVTSTNNIDLPNNIFNDVQTYIKTCLNINKRYFKSPDKSEWNDKWYSLDVIPNQTSIYGFSFNSQLVIKCTCDCHNVLKFINYKCFPSKIDKSSYSIEACDCSMEPFIELFNSKNINLCSWITVPVNKSSNSFTRNISHKDINPANLSSISPIIICSFDIECTSGDGSFPLPDRESDKIIMIATVFQRYGEDKPYLKHVCILGEDFENTDDTVYLPHMNESELILNWCKLINLHKPDIITGYNTLSFDMNYIWKRYKFMNKHDNYCSSIQETLVRFDKSYNFKTKASFESKKLESSALGYNDFNYIQIPGICHIDMLYYVKKEYKLSSYKLDDVANEFMGLNKDPVTPQMIFDLFKGSKDDKKIVVDYCVKDALLPIQLMLKLNTIPNLVQMSNVTRVPLRYLVFRGQQIKVFSQISYYAHKNNYVIPKITNSNQYMGEFVGAVVLDAKAGAYRTPVTALDFASLYPTIIIAHNLCYTTYISDTMWIYFINQKALSLINKNVIIPDKDIVFNEYLLKINNSEFSIKEFIIDNSYYRFVQKPIRGLLPSILTDLLLARKLAKKEMSKATDDFTKSLFNGKQLALKISCNSVYGFCGATSGMLPLINIARCVCAIGRTMIDKTKFLIEKFYDADVIYGDTDSNLVQFYPPDSYNGPTLNYAFEKGDEAAQFITAELNKDTEYKDVINLEFEKVYDPYMLFCKKRYCGLMYESLTKPPKIDIKGLQVVRRDNAPIVKEICNNIIKKLMLDNFNIGLAADETKTTIKDLINNKIPIEKLIVSKKLSNLKICSYKNHCNGKVCKNFAFSQVKKPDNQDTLFVCDSCVKLLSSNDTKYIVDIQKLPHVEVARKMMSRPGYESPSPGDRIPYVFTKINKKEKGVLQYKLAEDPDFVIKNNIPLDFEYYLKHQIKNPVSDLFQLVRDPNKLIFDEIERDIVNKNNKQIPLTSFFTQK